MSTAKRPRILVLTGDGKGKTTSALGMLLRALGHGQRTLLARFCKVAGSGELPPLAALAQHEQYRLTILNGDHGMTPPPTHPDFPAHAACAQRLFARVQAAAPANDMIILDELCGALARNLLAENAVLDFLASLRPDQSVILTGRNAPPRLLAAADTVSEIRSPKHAYDQGREAQSGIEK